MKKLTTALIATSMMAALSTTALAQQANVERDGQVQSFSQSVGLQQGDIFSAVSGDYEISFCNCTKVVRAGETYTITGNEDCSQAFMLGRHAGMAAMGGSMAGGAAAGGGMAAGGIAGGTAIGGALGGSSILLAGLAGVAGIWAVKELTEENSP